MNLNLLYVCQNGKGRSQALSAYTEKFLADKKIERVSVRHSGVNYHMIERLRRDHHDSASFTFNYLMKKEGVSLEGKKIVYIGELVKEPDLILTVDEKTLEKLLNIHPPYKSMSCVIGDLTKINPREIKGPYDHTWKASSKLDGYKKVQSSIKEHAESLVKTLETLDKSNLLAHLKHRV